MTCAARVRKLQRVQTLLQLHEQAKRQGWASGQGGLTILTNEAAQIGWRPVAQRRGEPGATVLTPVTAEQARPRSLSATSGLGPQPLHTDGAHLPTPPDILLLYCKQGSSTDTLLWRTGLANTWSQPSHLRDGMFLIDNGRDSFYAPALDLHGFRYDPGCMRACDQRAAAAAQYLADQLQHAERHSWATPGTVLLLDNRSVLHARAAVADDDQGREVIRLAYHLPRPT